MVRPSARDEQIIVEDEPVGLAWSAEVFSTVGEPVDIGWMDETLKDVEDTLDDTDRLLAGESPNAKDISHALSAVKKVRQGLQNLVRDRFESVLRAIGPHAEHAALDIGSWVAAGLVLDARLTPALVKNIPDPVLANHLRAWERSSQSANLDVWHGLWSAVSFERYDAAEHLFSVLGPVAFETTLELLAKAPRHRNDAMLAATLEVLWPSCRAPKKVNPQIAERAWRLLDTFKAPFALSWFVGNNLLKDFRRGDTSASNVMNSVPMKSLVAKVEECTRRGWLTSNTEEGNKRIREFKEVFAKDSQMVGLVEKVEADLMASKLRDRVASEALVIPRPVL